MTRRLQAVGVAAFPSLAPLELDRADPQLGVARHARTTPSTPSPAADRVVPGVPWRLANGPNGLRRPAPCLGQHTEEILTDLLGFTSEDIARLRHTGALPA